MAASVLKLEHKIEVRRVTATCCKGHTTLIATCSCGWDANKQCRNLGRDERAYIGDAITAHRLAIICAVLKIDFQVDWKSV